jgi:muramoyltetrapeptide carboxypeptidase
MRILDRLDADALRRDPKPIVGFSDLTALASWCVREAQVRPIHGPMVNQLGRLPGDDVEWLIRTLEDPAPQGEWPDALGRAGARGGGTVEGRLAGGNLEITTRLIGTTLSLDLGAAVFIMEDVGERPYRVDRALTQLKLAGLARRRARRRRRRLPALRGRGRLSAVGARGDRRAAGDLRSAGGDRLAHRPRRAQPGVLRRRRCAVDLGNGRLIVEEGAVS